MAKKEVVPVRCNLFLLVVV